MAELLAGEGLFGPFTAFAPNNDALEALGPDNDVSSMFMNNNQESSLTDILLYHVVQGPSYNNKPISIMDLACGGDVLMANSKFTQTLCVDDDDLENDVVVERVFQVREGNVRTSNSNNNNGSGSNNNVNVNVNVTYPEIVAVDIEACNGIIYILDKVMILRTRTPVPPIASPPPTPSPVRRRNK